MAFNEEHNILTEGYSPLGTGKLLVLPELAEIAKKYAKSSAQVALRWSLTHGYLPLPKSVTPSRILENYQIFDFEISEEDMVLLDALHSKAGLSGNPDTTEF